MYVKGVVVDVVYMLRAVVGQFVGQFFGQIFGQFLFFTRVLARLLTMVLGEEKHEYSIQYQPASRKKTCKQEKNNKKLITYVLEPFKPFVKIFKSGLNLPIKPLFKSP